MAISKYALLGPVQNCEQQIRRPIENRCNTKLKRNESYTRESDSEHEIKPVFFGRLLWNSFYVKEFIFDQPNLGKKPYAAFNL